MSKGFEINQIMTLILSWVERIKELLLKCVVVLLVGFLVLYEFYPEILRHIQARIGVPWVDVALGFTLGLVVLTLHSVWDLQKLVDTSSSRIFETQEEMYDYIAKEVQGKKPKDAVLLQYSCNTCKSLLATLLKEGTTVKAYMQNPDTAKSVGSRYQEDRIRGHLASLREEMSPWQERLQMLTYSAPGAISAVRIDSDLIALGWYIYQPVGTKPPGEGRFPNDRVRIIAHRFPGIVVRSGSSRDFKILNEFLNLLIKDYEGVPVKLGRELQDAA